MKNDILSKEGGTHEDANARMSSFFGVPAKSEAGVSEETLPTSPGTGIAFQLSKEKFIEAAKACYGNLYHKEIKGVVTAQTIGTISYTLPLKNLEFDFLPTSPYKLRKYKNAIKITGSASGEMKTPDMKPKRVFFKVYAVAEPKISSDFVYLQFKEFGVEGFAPSGENLAPDVMTRIQATLDPLINTQIRGKIKDIKLSPTELPFDEKGLVKARMRIVRVKENAVSFYVTAADQETDEGFEISPDGNEIHVSEKYLNNLIVSLQKSGVIPKEVEDRNKGIKIEIYRFRLDAEINDLYFRGRITLYWGTIQKSYDFATPITVSVDPATSVLSYDSGKPILKDVEESYVPGWVEKVVRALLLAFGLDVLSIVVKALCEIYKIILDLLKKLAKSIVERLEFPLKGQILIFPVPIPGTNLVYEFRCTTIKIGKDVIILRGRSEVKEVPQREAAT